MLGTTLLDEYRKKLGGDEGAGPVLSGFYFEGDSDGKLEGEGYVEDDTP